MPINHNAVWLRQLHAAFNEALQSNNFEALGACYTETSVLLPPASQIVIGRKAIIAYWQGAERVQALAFHALDTKAIDGGSLREAGSVLVTMRRGGRETFNSAAKYVAVWLQGNGGWKIDSMAWDGAARAAGGRRQGQAGRRAGQGAGVGGGDRGKTGAGGGQRQRQGHAREAD